MKNKISLIAVLSFGLTALLYSQKHLEIADSLKGEKFSTIVDAIDQYYDGKDHGRGSGYKQAQRWIYYNSTRLDEEGYLKNVTLENWKAKLEHDQKSASYKSSGSFTGNWTSFGADSYERLASGYNGGNGRVNVVVVDPANSDIVYAGTPGGGLFRTTDEGGTWEALTDLMPRLGVSGIAIDPSSSENNRTIYILTGDGDGGDTPSLGVFKSVDNGDSWMSTGLHWATGGERSHKLIMHPTDYNTLFAVTRYHIHKTTDGALTWQEVANGSFCDIEFNTGNPDIMYASTVNGKVYRSSNGGNNWSEVSFPTAIGSNRIAIAVTPANPNYLYALIGGVPTTGQFAGLYLSTDGGLTFSLQSNTPNILGYSTSGSDGSQQAWYDLAIAVSPTNENEVHTGGISAWKSTDAGQTWSYTSNWYEKNAGAGNYTHADIHAMEFYGNIIYCGSDGGVFLSRNNAEDWINISAGLEITQFYRIGGSENQPDVVFGGAQDNGMNKLTNGTIYHWYGADGFEAIADPADPNTYYGTTQNGGLQKTTNNGSTSSSIKPYNAGNGAWSTPYTMHPTDNQTLFAGYADVWKTVNGGLSWANISNGATGTGYASLVKVAPSNDNYIYVSKSSVLYRTIDGGNIWSAISTNKIGYGSISYFVVHPNDPNTVWLTQSQQVWKTTNGGATWTDISNNLPSFSANCITYQENELNRVYVGMDVGVYYLDDSSNEWVDFSTGLVNVEITELEINYTAGKIRAATYGRGVWESDLVVKCAPQPTAPQLKSAPTGSSLHLVLQAESFLETGGAYDGFQVYDNPDAVGGQAVNWVQTGDWGEYQITALGIGTYRPYYYTGTTVDGAAVELSIDGVPVSTTPIPNNNNWDVYQEVRSDDLITIDSYGTHTVTIKGAGTNGWEWNMDYFSLIYENNIAVTGVDITEDAITLNDGDTHQLTAVVSPFNATDTSVTWSSSNPAIASVNSGGLVTANSAGNATITVTTNDGGFTDVCQVTVNGDNNSTDPIVVEAETFVETGGTYNDGFVPYGVNRGATTINYVNTGDWAEYNFDVVTAGDYSIQYAISTPSDNAQIQILIDGVSISTDNVTNNGQWDSYYTLGAANNVTLSVGSHTLRVVASGTNAWQWNLDKVTLNPIEDGYIPVTGVTFKDRLAKSRLGSPSFQLIPIITPEDATDQSVRYESDDESIIVVSETGLLTGVDLGTTTVRVITNDGNYSDELNVEIFGTAVTGVTVSEQSIDLDPSDTYQLTATVQPVDASITSVTWSSNNENVATVNAFGLVTAVSEGTAIVTVKTDHRGYEATCTVNVGQDVNVTGISFSITELTLLSNDSYQLVPIIEPANATDKSVTWSSGNINVATVDANGYVNAVAEGSTNITATTNDGGYTANVNVQVDNDITIPDPIVVEAETFVETGGTYDDGYVPFGANRSAIGINYVNTNDWVEYNVDVVTAGDYDITYAISSPSDNAQVQFLLNGNVISTDNVPNNGEWDNYTPLEATSSVYLSAGSHTVRILASGSQAWQWNLDNFTLTYVVTDECIPVSSAYKEAGNELKGYYAGAMPGKVVRSMELEDEAFASESTFNIYPNPATSEFSVEFDVTNNLPVTIQILNLVGELQEVLVNQEYYTEGSYEVSYVINNLDAGIYLVELKNGSESKVEKLIIE